MGQNKMYSFQGFKISKNLISSVVEAGVILIPAVAVSLATNDVISGSAAGVVASIVNKAYKFYRKEIKQD